MNVNDSSGLVEVDSSNIDWLVYHYSTKQLFVCFLPKAQANLKGQLRPTVPNIRMDSEARRISELYEIPEVSEVKVGGSLYVYSDVEEKLFHNLVQAESVGHNLWVLIKKSEKPYDRLI